MRNMVTRIVLVCSIFLAAFNVNAAPVFNANGITGLLVQNKYLVNLRFEANFPAVVYPEGGGQIGYGTNETILERVNAFNETHYPLLSAPIVSAIAELFNSTPEAGRPSSINGCEPFNVESCYIFFPSEILYQLAPMNEPYFRYVGPGVDVSGPVASVLDDLSPPFDVWTNGTLLTLGIIEDVYVVSAPQSLPLVGLGLVMALLLRTRRKLR